jgi:amino acid adenylation domain-containing protein
LREPTRNLACGFWRSADRFDDRPALDFGQCVVTYAQLRELACSLAATLDKHQLPEGPRLVAILAGRSTTAFGGVLAALLSGGGYVPLDPAFPASRNRAMFEIAGCAILLVHPDCIELADQVLSDVHRDVTIVMPEQSDVAALTTRWPRFRVLGAKDLEPAHAYAKPAELAPDTIANLLFTSGSTGVPKGVMVTHANIVRFVDVMCQRYELSEHDRFSQTFPLTFDLAGFDMFMAWEVGGCICCPSPGELMMAGAYVCAARLTVWFSVPLLALHMKRSGMLEPDQYPALRYSLFCGEALPAEVLNAWAKAAPNSILENLYGPTELTLACTLYRWDCQRSPAECEGGIVPIGEPCPGMEYLVVDESLHEVPPGETGQLLLTGPQRTLGYWNDPAKTAAAFVIPPERSEIYYCTGDRVRRPPAGRPLTYLGRLDLQVRVKGLRVELGEVEAALRDLAGVDVAIAVGWPRTPDGADGHDGIVAFLGVNSVDAGPLAMRLRERLPRQMIPQKIIAVAEFPVNVNGKVDRKMLARWLDEGRVG